MLTINEIRSENAGKVCLVWRGNVYESFDGDAYIVARVCGATIRRTHREDKLRNVAEFDHGTSVPRDMCRPIVPVRCRGRHI